MNMKRFMNKKVVAIGLAAGLTLGAAGAAFAYFTTTGSGNGSAATGSATALIISQTNTVTGLLPGGPAGTIDLSVDNTTDSAQTVGPITVTVTAVTSGTLTAPDSLGNVPETCTTSLYTTTPSAEVGTIPANSTATTTATVSLKEDNNNEDNCQAVNGGGALTLHFSA
jgi:hypothetical protein